MDSGWQQRRALAALLRVAVTLVPVVASVTVGILAHQLLPVPTTVLGALLRAGGVLAVSLPTLAVVDALARRFLPLTVLLQLSLIFPDQTPSRFKLALKAGSGRRMAKAVGEAKANGLADDPTTAAEQLVLLATAIGDHDRRTRGHSERVRLYAELIGEGMGLSAAERAKLQWAALIHDIGKVTVPPEILNKKGKPDAAEWAILQGHPAAGEALIEPVAEWLGEWVHAVGGHHEKWDGSGYPRGLSGSEIPRSAAIVAVADSFEVMTAVRSYKKAMTLADARRELTRCAGTHFSPEVVRGFLNLSIGDLRRSMGVLAALAHVPVLGRLSTAASYAPDTVTTAVHLTGSTATAGAGAVAMTAAVTVGMPGMAEVATPPAAPAPVVAAAAPVTESPQELQLVRVGTVKEKEVVVVVEPTTTTSTTIAGDGPATATSVAPTPRRVPARPERERERIAPVAETFEVAASTAAPLSPPSTSVAPAPEAAVAAPTARAATTDDDVVSVPAPEPARAAPEHSNAGGNGNGNGNAGGNGTTGGSGGSGTGGSNANPGGNGNGAANGNAGGNANGAANGNAGGNGNGNGHAASAPAPAPPAADPPGNGNGNGNAGGNGNGRGNGRDKG